MATTVSGRFGRKPATRSPTPTPIAAKAAAAAATSRRSSRWLIRRCRPCSFQNTIASRSSSWRSRFSAKLSRAPGNQRGPRTGSGGAIRSRPMTTSSHGARPSRSSATTPQNRQTSGQKASGRATDQAWSVAKSSTDSAPGGRWWRTLSRKRVMFARAARSGAGVQMGPAVDRSVMSGGGNESADPGSPAGHARLSGLPRPAGQEVGGLNCACCASSHDLW